jgi:hypothetical protein
MLGAGTDRTGRRPGSHTRSNPCTPGEPHQKSRQRGRNPDVVFLDNAREGERFVDDPEITGRYQEEFIELEDLAAPPSQLADYVSSAKKGFAERA